MSESGPKRLKRAARLLEKGRAAGAARVIRRASLEAERTDDQETLYAVSALVNDARSHLGDADRRTFDAILSGVEEEPARTGLVEVGLVLFGIVGLAVAIFLPLAESKSFGRVAENTLIQNGWGWAFIALGAIAVVELIRVTRTDARSAVIFIVGVIVLGLAIYLGTNDELLTLCPVSDLFVPECEVASPGIGVYATGIAGLLLAIGGWQIAKVRRPDALGTKAEGAPETKSCPDCAETVLAAANVCKHCGYRFSEPARGGQEQEGQAEA